MMRIVKSGCFWIALLLLPWSVLGQNPGNFATSLHGTRKGKITWYSQANGGFESLTGVPMDSLPCIKCHALTYANGDTVDAKTYEPGCNDCHDFSQGSQVAQKTCLGCHARQGAEIKIGLPDVHREKGFECMNCHTKKEMHGDGTEYASMFEPGAMEASCTNDGCHPLSSLPVNTAHAIHSTKVYCNACHATTVITCYNCHFETEVQAHQKRFFGPPPSNGFVLLIRRKNTGLVTTGSLQSLVYGDTTFYAIGPFNSHSITRQARACEECHNSQIVQSYRQNGKIEVIKWDETNKKLVINKGVIPVPPDWQTALDFDFITYTGDVHDPAKPLDPNKWTFLKTGADKSQMLYAEPLTSEQLDKLSVPVSVLTDRTTVPTQFELMQNYPNPFNPSTQIRFALPKDTRVSLKVYDLTGRLVKILLENEPLSAGVHRTTLSAAGMPSGVYFYQLQTPEFSATRKMTVIR